MSDIDGGPHANRLRRDNRGALLISLILTLTLMATLGAAMIYMTSSSGYGFSDIQQSEKSLLHRLFRLDLL